MHKLQIKSSLKNVKMQSSERRKMLLARFVDALYDNHRRLEIREAVFHLINSALTKQRDEVKQAVRYIPAFSS